MIFNLAGQSPPRQHARPDADLEINCPAPLTIPSCRYKHPDVKVVFAGTLQVYVLPLFSACG